MKKGDILEMVEVETMAAEGKALAKVDDQILFISGCAPGDVLDVRIIRKRKKFLEGIPVTFHKYSSHRVEPFCQYFGTCGGCKWQHIPYQMQLDYKEQQVVDNIERIGKVKIKNRRQIIGSDQTAWYRNKLEFTFSDSRWLTREEIDSGRPLGGNALGFHVPKIYDKVLDIEKCHLQPDPSNEIKNKVRKYASEHQLSYYNIKNHNGFLRNLIIRTATSKDVMVILQVAKDEQDILFSLLDFIYEQFPEITSLNYVINTKLNDTFSDLDVITYKGTPYITENMPLGDGSDEFLTFRISPKSFYQTNSKQAIRLYAEVMAMADLKGSELVYDLYSGTGTIANFIARYTSKVIGLEFVREATEDARTNAKLNGIGNTEFYAGDIRYLLDEKFIERHGKPDVVITDPPRSGMHADIVERLNNLAADRIVYISCNPATQARDIALLTDKYDLINYQPIDMFPQTHHVENIVLLKLK